MKIWTSEKKDDDKIIAYLNDVVYKANPPSGEMADVVAELKIQNPTSKYFFGIPVRYISEINLQEGKSYIEILFRNDTEHLKIKDDAERNEVFEFFKQNIPGATYSVLTPSKLESAKKPLIAMGVICAIFLWTLYIAEGLEAGNGYDVTGQRYHSLAGIVLVLASLGVKNLTLIFGSLFLITSFSFVKKYTTPIVKNRLVIKH
jgi:hypothetical protein